MNGAKRAGLVEHVTVHQRAADVERELRALTPDFTIRADVADLTYRKHHAEMRRWLVHRARTLVPHKQDVADLLGISRVTLATWENELPPKKQNNA